MIPSRGGLADIFGAFVRLDRTRDPGRQGRFVQFIGLRGLLLLLHSLGPSVFELQRRPGILVAGRREPGLTPATANRVFSFGMTVNERLADHFIKAAPIAAVYVDAAGGVSAFDVVGFEAPPNGVLLCCAAGKQVAIVAKAAIAPARGPDAALAALRAAAANAGVGLTPHRAVVRRALATVEMVNDRIRELQQTGSLRGVNAEFKAARAAGKSARYRDFLHAKKLAMLAAIAGRV